MSIFCLAMPLGGSWEPLQCSLTYYFETDLSPKEVVKKLSPAFECRGPITIRSIGPDMFGARNDVEVDRVDGESPLKLMHNAVYSTIMLNPDIHILVPEWWNSGYKSHVTKQGSQDFPAGSTAKLTHVVLVEKVSESLPKKAHHIWELRPVY